PPLGLGLGLGFVSVCVWGVGRPEGESSEVVIEPVEALGPDPLVPREPRRRVGERRRGESRAPPPAFLASGDERRALEHLEVSGNRREADGEGGRELRDRRLTDGESLDDAPAGGGGERTEEQVEVLARPFWDNT